MASGNDFRDSNRKLISISALSSFSAEPSWQVETGTIPLNPQSVEPVPGKLASATAHLIKLNPFGVRTRNAAPTSTLSFPLTFWSFTLPGKTIFWGRSLSLQTGRVLGERSVRNENSAPIRYANSGNLGRASRKARSNLTVLPGRVRPGTHNSRTGLLAFMYRWYGNSIRKRRAE